MTQYDFDKVIDRRNTHSIKWDAYGDEVLPMWVADMDFMAPPVVMDYLQQHIEHGVFGYTFGNKWLTETLVERMKTRYQWDVKPEEILYLPGLVYGLNVVARTVGQAGDGVLMQTPVYGPFLTVPRNNQRFAQLVDLEYVADSPHTFHYETDFDKLEAVIKPETSLMMLCNPHNPGGFAYTRDELHKLAEMCERHNLIICSDEIHSDLLLDGAKHTPIASLSPEISARTITLLAPSKTFNLPGLGCSVAIVQDKALREQVQQTAWGMGAHVNTLGFTGALAAYQHGQEWLDQLLPYLQANRDAVVNYVREHLPHLKTTVPHATYLAWLDARSLALPNGQTPYQFFKDHAKVALNDGVTFSPRATHFVRLNFGTARSTLLTGLERLKEAMNLLG